MYKDTVTLFKRDPEKRLWYPTLLRGVNLQMDRAAIVAKYGEQSSDAAILNVRYTVNKCLVMVDGNVWVPPKDWTEPNQITFTGGNDFDFFWAGEWTDGDVDDRDYTGGFYQHMNRTKDFVFAITGFTRFSVIPHFEVRAR